MSRRSLGEWSEWDEVRTALVVHGRQSREVAVERSGSCRDKRRVISYRLQKTAS